ncbi:MULTISPECIES: UvrD-helicase domain-containing protein [unclassified Francisella]|uniref:UvrD-helicase domain-containing protein n=1 Tax=unclassified Francisella TaxID=2610885 RepID=UPI002E31D843|nr:MULTISPECIES: UvrD-helicase domain-containing protein [unclassified Francisella]MED7818350.1 UvrD-helicase domain-containing protein [Francisella sp. 19S2-4]MED7829186.1 UvrD-helicase domain-containing protein [Francisella sp. 19S2-10]
MKNLDAKIIPLQGHHIIEASAGTGKTYNITELYIRLLLEKKLLPSQILVMTFTKDATQEIIGRVEAKIREVLASYTDEKKEFDSENYKHLKRALLEIDEAAIFTIHGFCKKVLSEQAFASGMEMDVSMEVDTSDILQKVVENFFRKHINKNKANFEYLKAYNLHTPEKFLDRNGLLNVIKSNYEILNVSENDFFQQKKVIFQKLDKHSSEIEQGIIFNTNKKNKAHDAEVTKRKSEFDCLKSWLSQRKITTIPKEAKDFAKLTRIKNDDTLKKIFAEWYDLFIGRSKTSFSSGKDAFYKDSIDKDEQVESFINKLKSNEFIKQFCLKIRQDFVKAKEQKGVLDFNDLITKLCQSVKNSPDLVKTLQAQYPVALIDEFQDTDAEQYEILDTIYPKDREDLLLLMIGDPKQAIYGFRGGDIFTYLKAKNSCLEENQWSMDTNWRSTREMIKAYNRLFYKKDYKPEDEGKLGENIFSEGIGYQIVKASSKANEKARDFEDGLKPINYFYYEVSEEDKKNDIDKNLSAWTANEIVRLLNSKKVVENDIAILVETGIQAKEIQQALSNKKLSSVYLSQRDNVYHSQEATEILAVMEGINDLENKSLLKKALSTSLLGGSADKFIRYTDDDDISAWDEEIEKAKSLRMKWHKYGFMAFIMQLIHESFSQRDDSKERTITNILHLAELIKIAENKYKHPNQLIKWYRQQLKNTATSEGELRLESDDNLIKIITIHGSKGLEYSVVFIPFASYIGSKKLSLNNSNKYYDNNLEQIVYKIGKDDATKKLVEQETIQELMRLFYVAVTRAEHRCYIGVAKYSNSENSSIAQFLGYEKDESWLEKVQKITANPDNQSLLLEINNFESLELKNINKTEINQQLQANEIAKLTDDNWEMLSFSKISKSKAQNTALEKENDESEDSQVQESQDELEFRFTAPKGADIGNILHNVLEHTDFSAGFVDDALLQEQMDRYRVVAAEDFDNLKAWLEECLVAEIKPIKNSDISESDSKLLNSNEDIQYSLFDGSGEVPKQSQHNVAKKSFCLKDIPNSKTLKEAEFYFPITNEKLYKNNIIRILEEYRNNSIMVDELSNYKIFGMLHGFIDLVFEYDGKFYVADYKSNYLGDKLEDYNQQAMQEKNQSSFYDLQYLIYSVALNKYLKQNIPNYNFEKHFGGVYYFYLRGMKNGYGVYQASPSFEIISKLSNLLNGGSNV